MHARIAFALSETMEEIPFARFLLVLKELKRGEEVV